MIRFLLAIVFVVNAYNIIIKPNPAANIASFNNIWGFISVFLLIVDRLIKEGHKYIKTKIIKYISNRKIKNYGLDKLI